MTARPGSILGVCLIDGIGLQECGPIFLHFSQIINLLKVRIMNKNLLSFVSQLNKNKMKTATYSNKATGETYKLNGVNSLRHAWSLSEFVCRRNDWNHSMFCNDVKVTVN